MTGYAARFNSPSEILAEKGRGVFREIILPGAFTRSLATPPRGDILALWLHGADGRPPLGRTPNTLRLWEDAHGLGFELQLPESAADVREAVERQDVRGMSFGFAVDAKDRWRQDGSTRVREVIEAPLFEISLVIRPAYPSTTVAARDVSALVPPPEQRSHLGRARLLLEVASRE